VKTVEFVADYLCRTRHRELVRNVYQLHSNANDHANAVRCMKSVYPLALEFGALRKRRFEREARGARHETADELAAAERERDLKRESTLLVLCSQFCDFAVYGAVATDTYQRTRDMEVEVVQAGLAGDPALARSRMSAWKAARKEAVAISWVGGVASIARPITVTRVPKDKRNRNVKGGGRGTPSSNNGGGGPRRCHKCNSTTHLAAACGHATPQPGSNWAKSPAKKKKK
jgi:hypothetical protein